MHNPSWPYSPELWFSTHVLSDSPYIPFSEWRLDQYEFGHMKHPNVRLLSQCFPKALFVLNTRSLGSWVRSKVNLEAANARMRNAGRPLPPCDSPFYPRPSWRKDITKSRDAIREKTKFESDVPARPNMTDPLYSALGARMCDTAMAREQLHLLYIKFVAEDPTARLQRFLIIDLPAEGYAGAMLRICRFLSTWRGDPVEGCDSLAEMNNTNAHSSHHTNGDCENEYLSQVLTKNSTKSSTKHADACASMNPLVSSDLASPHLSNGAMTGEFASLVNNMRKRFMDRHSVAIPTTRR